VERRRTFSDESDFLTYLDLLRDQWEETRVQVRDWCLMSHHLHRVAVPQRDDSLGTLLRRVHGRYAQYYNARWGRTGHLGQSRDFARGLGPAHLWRALAYVERNPVRAGLVPQAADYRWSSARAHRTGREADGIVDLEWWEREKPANWEPVFGEEEAQPEDLRRPTWAPLGR
jgi:putative transposase